VELENKILIILIFMNGENLVIRLEIYISIYIKA